jgi:hypothetical protein
VKKAKKKPVRRQNTTAEKAVREVLQHLKGPNARKAIPKKTLDEASGLLYSLGVYL